jgi:acyl-CoA synthetase (AMP-forming)/AMP-acid ligase II
MPSGPAGSSSYGQPAASRADEPRSDRDAWHLLELAAIHHADTLAVVDCAAGGGGRQLTYSQLFDRTTSLAAHLASVGVRRGDRIGVLSRNASYVIELHFAAAALHAVVVNMNIHLAPRELAFIAADSAPKVVFADTHVADSLLAAHAELCSQAAESQQGRGASPVFGSVVWMQVEGSSHLPAAQPGMQVGVPADCCRLIWSVCNKNRQQRQHQHVMMLNRASCALHVLSGPPCLSAGTRI